jgi:hypothetical protein
VEPDHLEQEILDHLVVEFREFGERAVSYLLSARALVEGGLELFPRAPEGLAYFVREALKAITNSQAQGDAGAWKHVSRAVVSAKQRFVIESEGLPGQDPDLALRALMQAVDDMATFHQGRGVHQANLISVIVNRTGSLPHEIGNSLVDAYQRVLSSADSAAHGSCAPEQARQIYDDSTKVLRQLFAPPDIRHAGLERLASLPEPTEEDLVELTRNVLTAQHLQEFLKRLTSTRWLALLGQTTLLDPPSNQDRWPGYAVIDALVADHADDVAAWLTRVYDRCGQNPAQAHHLLRAAVDTGDHGRALIARVLGDHPSDPAIRGVASWALDSIDPADDFTEVICDVLLTPAGDDPWTLGRTAKHLVDGLTRDNGVSRLTLISYKIRSVDKDRHGWRWFSVDQSGSIADRDLERREDHFDVLLAAFVAAVQQVHADHGYQAVLDVGEDLPEPVRTRLRAWLLGTDTDVDVSDLLRELVTSVATRAPTGDDLPIIARVLNELPHDECVDALQGALGTAPPVNEVARALASHDLGPDWIRCHEWLGLIPETMHGSWTNVYETIASEYGRANSSRLQSRPSVEASWGRSPFSADQLNDLGAIEAAELVASWRPDANEFLVGARELARSVEAAVQAEPERWLAEPFRVAMALHEPSYISHYLAGAAKTVEALGDETVGQLLDLLKVIGEHPWQPTPLGRGDFDYDPDWRGAEIQGIALVRAFCNANLDLVGRDDEVFQLVIEAVANRSESSGILSETDALTAAINRPSTKALEALISFMGYEFRRTGAARPAAYDVLDEVLRLGGADGLQCRAILASRFSYFTATAPEWVEANAELLFGSEAPDGLGQETIDLTLQWSQTNAWLMEHRMSQALDAAARGVDHAMDHVLIAYLWQTPGYTARDLVNLWSTHEGVLSRSGEALGRLARQIDNPEHLQRAVEYWDVALAHQTRESRSGFGWFSTAAELDDTEWASRTLATIEISGGQIDWLHGITERVNGMEPTSTTLAILGEIIRNGNQDWSLRETVTVAAEYLQRAAGLASTPEYQRLHTALRERGF